MGKSFEDRLGRLVLKETTAASEANDSERLSGVVNELAMALGEAIALTCDADEDRIDKVLDAVAVVVTQTAAMARDWITALKCKAQKVRLK